MLGTALFCCLEVRGVRVTRRHSGVFFFFFLVFLFLGKESECQLLCLWFGQQLSAIVSVFVWEDGTEKQHGTAMGVTNSGDKWVLRISFLVTPSDQLMVRAWYRHRSVLFTHLKVNSFTNTEQGWSHISNSLLSYTQLYSNNAPLSDLNICSVEFIYLAWLFFIAHYRNSPRTFYQNHLLRFMKPKVYNHIWMNAAA